VARAAGDQTHQAPAAAGRCRHPAPPGLALGQPQPGGEQHEQRVGHGGAVRAPPRGPEPSRAHPLMVLRSFGVIEKDTSPIPTSFCASSQVCPLRMAQAPCQHCSRRAVPRGGQRPACELPPTSTRTAPAARQARASPARTRARPPAFPCGRSGQAWKPPVPARKRGGHGDAGATGAASAARQTGGDGGFPVRVWWPRTASPSRLGGSHDSDWFPPLNGARRSRGMTRSAI